MGYVDEDVLHHHIDKISSLYGGYRFNSLQIDPLLLSQGVLYHLNHLKETATSPAIYVDPNMQQPYKRQLSLIQSHPSFHPEPEPAPESFSVVPLLSASVPYELLRTFNPMHLAVAKHIGKSSLMSLAYHLGFLSCVEPSQNNKQTPAPMPSVVQLVSPNLMTRQLILETAYNIPSDDAQPVASELLELEQEDGIGSRRLHRWLLKRTRELSRSSMLKIIFTQLGRGWKNVIDFFNNDFVTDATTP
eukprot:gene42050-55806_t